jgi:uncharacterized membrane protein
MPLALDSLPARQKREFCFTSRPNSSLSERGRKQVFWLIAGVTLFIASVFAALGYWLTLPFAGIEIGVLAWAFDSLSRQSNDFESLTIDGDEVVIERRHEGKTVHLEFNRHWVCLVKRTERPGDKVSIALRSHGRETSLGQFLTDDARAELADSLQPWFRQGR